MWRAIEHIYIHEARVNCMKMTTCMLVSNALIHVVHIGLTCCALMLPGRTKLVIEESEGMVGMKFRSKNQMNVIFF